MVELSKITKPEEREVLIAFCDLTLFTRSMVKKTSLEVYSFISEFYKTTGDQIESAGGYVIKFVGDEVLCMFPVDRIDDGIMALRLLKQKLDQEYENRGLPMRFIVKAHFGPVAIGLLGTRTDKRLDIMGQHVNLCARLESHGFAITPEAFRKLKAETRKFFKKHTPAIRYIPVEEAHKD